MSKKNGGKKGFLPHLTGFFWSRGLRTAANKVRDMYISVSEKQMRPRSQNTQILICTAQGTIQLLRHQRGGWVVGSVRPKFGIGIENQNQYQNSVSVSEPKPLQPKPKLQYFAFFRHCDQKLVFPHFVHYSNTLRQAIKCPQKMLPSSKLHSLRLVLFSVV